MQKNGFGKLFIVSTPIGNLEDMSFRAVNLLNSVDLILCEDTRRTKVICNKYNIKTPLKSYYSYIEKQRTEEIIPFIKNGKNVALVSDSGTPSISDPGFLVVKECIKSGISVSHIPGPTAFVSALVCSGLPTERVIFLGFTPKKVGKIQKLFNEIKVLRGTTIVFYESPYRVVKTLNILLTVFNPYVQCVLAREITKVFEEFIRGSLKEIYELVSKRNIKGECVILIYNE
ncbi:MAG: 16S rRNA (cytidine(1402)-2'-O)-methyltransferase [Endomicrobia bacterium]|nr:16S rRNA (cytidine(1402)-2'-O)-methyltransferase [Endomicrobiia bacterium]